jgi:hypothetical protein
LYKSNRSIINSQRRAEVTSTNYFTFFETRTNSFRESTSHSWNDTPTQAQSVVIYVTGGDLPCYKS